MCQNCMLIITPILNCNDQLGPDLFWSHFWNSRCSPCITNSAPGIRPVQALQSALLPVPASAAPHLHLRTNYLLWTAHVAAQSTLGIFAIFCPDDWAFEVSCIYMIFNPCPVCRILPWTGHCPCLYQAPPSPLSPLAPHQGTLGQSGLFCRTLK